MGKRKRRRDKEAERFKAEQTAQEAAPDEESISPLGKKTIAGGIGVLILGFYILTLTDPHGKNWASVLAPLLILGAYGIIGVGIFLPERCSSDSQTMKGTETETISTP